MEAGGSTVLCDHSLRAQNREEHFPKHCSQDSGPPTVFLIIPRDAHTLVNKERDEALPVERDVHFPTHGRLQSEKMLMSTLQKKV